MERFFWTRETFEYNSIWRCRARTAHQRSQDMARTKSLVAFGGPCWPVVKDEERTRCYFRLCRRKFGDEESTFLAVPWKGIKIMLGL